MQRRLRKSTRSRIAISRYQCLAPPHLQSLLADVKNLAWDVLKSAPVQGDGLTMGGLLILKQGNDGVAYAYAEERFGDHAENETIMNVCRVVAARK